MPNNALARHEVVPMHHHKEIGMSFKKSALIVAVLAAFSAHGAFAADEKSRAEVKAEAKAAVKSTDCAEAATMPKAQSDKTRAEVKAAGKGTSRECEASPAPAAKSEKSRAEVKKEVKDAVKSGELSKSDAMEKAKK